MKIVVTGASGFIGNHTYKFLKNKGYDVVGWDCIRTDDTSDIAMIDMLDGETISDELNNIKPDVIIHCAGAADVGKSISSPSNDYNGNVTTTHNLLFGLVKTQLFKTKVIFLSSAAVYGDPLILPISEDSKLNPLSPYALHKRMCENICEYVHNNYEIDVKILRIFSAYGEGLKKQIFWDMNTKANQGQLCMFGTGDESRDYIHIDDLVLAIELIMKNAPSDDMIYNIANGEETTIRSATESFARAFGISCDKIEFSGEKKSGNPVNWCADIERIKRLGYKKTVDFDEGIKRYVRWAQTEVEGSV